MVITLFMSLILPILVHPMSYDTLGKSPAPMLQAAIDTARIIGLPRLKTMDLTIYRTIYLNEVQSGPVYRAETRKIFIQNYIKNM